MSAFEKWWLPFAEVVQVKPGEKERGLARAAWNAAIGVAEAEARNWAAQRLVEAAAPMGSVPAIPPPANQPDLTAAYFLERLAEHLRSLRSGETDETKGGG